MSARIAACLFANCRAFTDGGKPYALFDSRNRRLWLLAERLGVSDAVRSAVTPRLVDAYPKWARETGLAS